MKREILFRGKRVDNEEWGYGYLFCTTFSTVKEVGLQPCIQVIKDGIYYTSFEVIPETIGQYTGLTDKNGVKIFEGDFVREKTNPCSQNKDCIAEPDPLRDRYEIKWDERRNGWNAFPKTSLSIDDFNIAIQQLGGLITWPCDDVLSNSWHYAIIGNIHDNP